MQKVLLNAGNDAERPHESLFFSQIDDLLHSGQIQLRLGRLFVCSAAVCDGSPAVSLPAAVLPALLCFGDEGPHCNHGCRVQKGKNKKDAIRTDLFFISQPVCALCVYVC